MELRYGLTGVPYLKLNHLRWHSARMVSVIYLPAVPGAVGSLFRIFFSPCDTTFKLLKKTKIMRLTLISATIGLLLAQVGAFDFSGTDGILLSRSYKSKLVAVKNDLLNGRHVEGAELFGRQTCTGTQCPGKQHFYPSRGSS
jgi:hypothetical protein